MIRYALDFSKRQTNPYKNLVIKTLKQLKNKKILSFFKFSRTDNQINATF